MAAPAGGVLARRGGAARVARRRARPAPDPRRGGTGLALAEPEWLFHWGANPGFRALFVGSRARGQGVVVVTDSDGGMELAARVVRERFGELALLGFPLLYPPD